MARSRGRRSGSFSTGRSAATVMSSHIAKQGTKGNRKPSRRSSRSETASSSAVGGWTGATFSS
jgi:hypothetical protein